MADTRYTARPGLRTGAYNPAADDARRRSEPPARKSAVKRLVGKMDAYQRGHRWLGFPLAVVKKFGDDQAGYLAALVAYYAFFSLFPLLLVFVTVLGFVLGNNPELQQRIVGSVLAQLPVIGDQIKVGAMDGSGIALVIGILGALIGGLGVIQALQHGMDEIWDVPRTKRPNFLWSRIRALLLLAVLGVSSLASTFLSGIGSAGGTFGPALKLGSVVASLALNFGLFLVAFRVLTAATVRWKDVAPGAALGAVAWAALQAAGTWLVGSKLESANGAYGVFAIVIGLLSFLYIGGQITYLAAEVNVVKTKRLWPRSLQPPLTEAERRALTRAAKQEKIRPEEDISVDFDSSSRARR
jgi:YihY family inner membrane protein